MQEEMNLEEWLNLSDDLTKAVKDGEINTVRDLLNTIDVNERDSKSCTPLEVAVDNKHYEIAKLLLERGANINHENHNTILFKANSNIPMMELLLSYNQNLLDKTNEDGLNILEQSVKDLNINIVKWLVCEKGLSINTVEFLVHKAMPEEGMDVFEGNTENKIICILKFLHEQGADINERDEEGCMPMHYAAMYGSAAIVKYFLDNGCNFRMANSDNEDLLYLAVKENNLDVFKYLMTQKNIVREFLDHEHEDGITPIQLSVDLNGGLNEIGVKLIIEGSSTRRLNKLDYDNFEDFFLDDPSLPEKIVVLGNILYDLEDYYDGTGIRNDLDFVRSQLISHIESFKEKVKDESLGNKERLKLCEQMTDLISKISIYSSLTEKYIENFKNIITKSITSIQKEHEHDLDLFREVMLEKTEHNIAKELASYFSPNEFDDIMESIHHNTPKRIKEDILARSTEQYFKNCVAKKGYIPQDLKKFMEDTDSAPSPKKAKINPEDLTNAGSHLNSLLEDFSNIGEYLNSLVKLSQKCGLPETLKSLSNVFNTYTNEVKDLTNDYFKTEEDLAENCEASCVGEGSPPA